MSIHRRTLRWPQAVSSRICCVEVTKNKNAVALNSQPRVRCQEKSLRYCSVSIRRVMVRFKSLSDRRISSILLIECSTVV